MKVSKVILFSTMWSLLFVATHYGEAQEGKESFMQESLKAGEFLRELYEQGQYEAWDTRRASKIVSPQLLSGPHHHVEETVESQGPLSIFTVQSTFGPFEVKGETMLRRLIREIYALAVLQDLTRTEAFQKGLKEAGRHKTVIVRSLASMEKTRNRHRVIELALSARTENDALCYQQVVEILAGFHRGKSPIDKIIVYRGLPLGYAKNGTLIFGFPVDYGRWVPFADYLMRGFAETRPHSHPVRAREAWITGTLSPKAKKEITALNITVKEEIDQKIGMID